MVDQLLADSVRAEFIGKFGPHLTSERPPDLGSPPRTALCIWRLIEHTGDGGTIYIFQISFNRTILALKEFRKSEIEELGRFVEGAVLRAGLSPRRIRSVGLTKKQRDIIGIHTGFKVVKFQSETWSRRLL